MSIVALQPRPTGWREERLGRLAPRSKACDTPDLEPLSVFLGAGVVPRSAREDNHNELGADLSKYLTVRPGDIVFNKLRTWQGGLGVSRHHGIVSPAYYVLSPGTSVHPGYVHYLLQSAPYLAEFTRLSKWMPPSQFDIGWEELRDVPVLLPPLGEQRRIADFLDDQVTRIDAAIETRNLQLGLLRERVQARYDAIFDGPEQPLKRLLRQSPCYGVLVPRFVDAGGVPFIRVSDLEVLNRGATQLRQIERSQSLEYRRTVLSVGDVLLSVVGSVDKSAVVGQEQAGANVARAVARLLPASGVPSLALWAWTRTTAYADQARLVTGSDTAQPTLNMGDLKGFVVAWPRHMHSAELEDQVREVLRFADVAEGEFKKSVSLLQERKRALITAAVTGEFDVSTAGPRAAAAVTA